MVEIQSKEVINKVAEELKISPATLIPREIGKDIQLVYNVNPKRIVILGTSTARTATGTQTLFTASPSKDTYLTSAFLMNHSDATADNTSATYAVTMMGQAGVNLIFIGKITLTAFNDHISLSFNPPILLARNSTIVFGSTFTLGASRTSAGFTGYEVDTQ